MVHPGADRAPSGRAPTKWWVGGSDWWGDRTGWSHLGAPVSIRRALSCETSGVWRSLVAHLLWEQGVVGSNPATPTSSTTPGSGVVAPVDR